MSFLEILVTILAVGFIGYNFQKTTNSTERLKTLYFTLLENMENNFKEFESIVTPKEYNHKNLVSSQSRIDKSFKFLKNEIIGTFSNSSIREIISSIGDNNKSVFEEINLNHFQLQNLEYYSLDEEIKKNH